MPPSSPAAPAGLIGLGLMGQALASRLLAAGLDVVGHDLRGDAVSALVRQGGHEATSAAEVFARCPRVLLSLPSHREVGAVLAAVDPALRRGQIVIDTTTGDPAAAEQAAAALALRGVAYLDATVSGSSAQLAAGEAVIMVGGEAAAVAAVRDLLAPLGTAVFPTGGPGSGARMKLVTNAVLGLNRAALAEGLALAGGLGLDPAQALAVMQGGPAYSRIMDTKGIKMLTGDFTPVARLSQHLKDVRLILEQARAAGLTLPLSAAHRGILEQAEAAGLGEQDNSALFRILAIRTPPSP